jgi:hypothetical protein
MMAPCHSKELNAFIGEQHYTASKKDYPASFPISYHLLESEQQKDHKVNKNFKDYPNDYKTVSVHQAQMAYWAHQHIADNLEDQNPGPEHRTL